MFVLAVLEDTVIVKPHELGEDQHTVITRRLNERMANKIVPGVGLCIILYDLLEVGISLILPGSGNGHSRVKFRFVVFRPFVGEVIEAKVMNSTRDGLALSMSFFEDIRVPVNKLPQKSVFEKAEQIWYWEYPSDDGEPPAKLYMDPGKAVRFRVCEVIFKDVKPEAVVTKAEEASATTASNQVVDKSMEIIGTMAETGLGCVAWWTTTGEYAVEEEEDMDDE